MTAIEPLYGLMKINSKLLTRNELLILEGILHAHLIEHLKEDFRLKHKNYFALMRFDLEKEDNMLDATYLSLIIKDILLSEEYSLAGIARYADTCEDIIYEVLIGSNKEPSASLLQKIIRLHRLVRREWYDLIFKKINQDI